MSLTEKTFYTVIKKANFKQIMLNSKAIDIKKGAEAPFLFEVIIDYSPKSTAFSKSAKFCSAAATSMIGSAFIGSSAFAFSAARVR